MQARSTNLESLFEQACQTVPELHIPDDVQAKTKVKKLVVVVCDAKY